ncbi:MAG: flagellar protein [Proteobacteria bacterium]|nr:flagellar protein [Pseudomonadota bacterium]
MGEELRFSQHAVKRMESRGIDLSSDDLLKMQDAVKKAQEKGSKESLILSDKGAFVVSVKNNTVITAIDKGSLKENVFTNIDSTIMI